MVIKNKYYFYSTASIHFYPCVHVFYQNKNHKIDPAKVKEFPVPRCPQSAINILANWRSVFVAVGLASLEK